MPIAYLKFTLPEENDDYKLANSALDMSIALDDIRNFLREKLKYGHNYKSADEALEAVQEMFYDEIKNRHIDID